MASAPSAGAALYKTVSKEMSLAYLDLVRHCKSLCDPIMLYAGLQTALDKMSPEYTGIFKSVVPLLDRILATCGLCKTLLFIGSGLGHVEYALHTLIRCVVAANPKRYPYVDIKAVITDGMTGPNAPIEENPFVLSKSAVEAIEEYGSPETVVVQIKPDPSGVPTGAAEAAKRKGCPGYMWFGDVPCSGFNEAELDTVVAAARVAGEPLAEEMQTALKLAIIEGDGRQTLADGHPQDWRELNRWYTRFHIGEKHVVGSGKMAAWICFVLTERPMPLEKPIPVVPLPRLEGQRLMTLVDQYAALDALLP